MNTESTAPGAIGSIFNTRLTRLTTPRTIEAALVGLALVSADLASVQAGALVTVRPKVIDDVLVNPGIGFTTFQRFNGDRLNEGLNWTEEFPIEYQKYTGSLTNESHPLYQRLFLPGLRTRTASTSVSPVGRRFDVRSNANGV